MIIEEHTHAQHLDMNENNRFLNLEFIKVNELLKKPSLKIHYIAFLLVVISLCQRGFLMGYFSPTGKELVKVCMKVKGFFQELMQSEKKRKMKTCTLQLY